MADMIIPHTAFKNLIKIDCNGHTEKKNGLTYLSWSWAWGELKKAYPDATFKIYEDINGCFYHTDGKTCWVKTGVTVQGIEMIEYLPIMDYRNNSIPLEKVTSVDANKAIQRSITKAIARHGLGLYIYEGNEENPDAVEETAKQEETKAETKKAAVKKQTKPKAETKKEEPKQETPKKAEAVKKTFVCVETHNKLVQKLKEAGVSATDICEKNNLSALTQLSEAGAQKLIVAANAKIKQMKEEALAKAKESLEMNEENVGDWLNA